MVVETRDPAIADAKTYQQFIGGDWVAGATGETYTRTNPATGAPVETIPWGDVEDARKAIAAARAATMKAPTYRSLRFQLIPIPLLLFRDKGRRIRWSSRWSSTICRERLRTLFEWRRYGLGAWDQSKVAFRPSSMEMRGDQPSTRWAREQSRTLRSCSPVLAGASWAGFLEPVSQARRA